MGKKTKHGKQRRDVFYRRAKEAGYRARAAYKLIQLNKKYNFLQTTRVCVDLCAAPGSWMQVASKFMPVSSVIIGVDRYPIASIPNTISIQGDITTEKVRQDLKANLKTWKADLVLHDGAPNVGQNWLHDAYQQNLLVLHSFKLACEFLQKGGNFISKVFRSKDHLSLQYVFRKLFRRVEATKPIASRFESAEIFVVCQGFLAPDKIDPEFFDPKYVFQTLESEPKNKINVLKPEKTKRKAEGYEEGVTMLFKKNKISEFLKSPNYIDLLEETNEFEWDVPSFRESTHTTSEIVEFCKDIKVLGRKDLRTLINWRKAVKAEIEEEEKQKKLSEIKEEQEEEKEEKKDEIDEEFEELKDIQEQIAKLKADKERENKQHRKRIEKKKRKLEEKLKLRLMVPGDPGPQETGRDGLFSIETLNKAQTLDDVVDQAAEILADSESENELSDSEVKRSKYEYYSKSGSYLDKTGTYHKTANDSETEEENEEESSSDDEGLNIEKEEAKEEKRKKKVTFADQGSDSDDEPDDDTAKSNPLITDLVGDKVLDRRERKAETWFSKNVFDELETDEVEDYELESAINKYKGTGGVIMRKEGLNETGEKEEEEKSEGVSGVKEGKKRKLDEDFNAKDAPDSDSDSDSGVDSAEENEQEEKDKPEGPKRKKKEPHLSSFGLALATKMIRSKKAERDLYDEGWNRYMWGDEDLPDWFAKDEKKHNNPDIKVDKGDLKMYEDRNKAVDARTIKKVVEAKARKQRRMKKRMMRARKKAEVIANNSDMTAREKAQEMKKIYKKASSASKPKEKNYVVMKKSFGGRRPKGVKGPIKMVDRRLKKDKRAAENIQKKKPNFSKRKSKGKKS